MSAAHIFRASGVAAFILIALGCSSKKKEAPNIVKIKGDPYAFVKDTILDSKSGIDDSLSLVGGKWKMQLSGYAEEPTKSLSEVKESQNPDRLSRRVESHSNFTLLEFSRPSENEVSLEGNGFKFEFSVSNNRMHLNFLTIGSARTVAGEDFRLLHNSVSKDGRAFSILLYVPNLGDRALLAFYFVKRDLKVLPNSDLLSTSFNYLFGPGKKIGWNQNSPVVFNVFGKNRKILLPIFERSLEEWNSFLTGRLDLQISSSEKCSPFSDLNSRSVSFVEGWIEILGDYGVLGSTLSLADFEKGELIDVDIFMMASEYNETFNKMGLQYDTPGVLEHPELGKNVQRTATHEMGHALGLSHQFNDSIPSIMSYRSIHKIQSHDIEAIQALYPKKKSQQQFTQL